MAIEKPTLEAKKTQPFNNIAIEVKGLTKYFQNKRALNNVTFTVNQGEIFGYLGPNGAGKTTTVRILTGIIKPDRGSAKIMNYDILNQPIMAKTVLDILPEVSNAYPDLTAIQNLELIAQLHGKNKKDTREKAFKFLEEFELYERKNDKVKTFSKGMKRRLMFCMSLISDPLIIFLDEPTSGLDVVSSHMLRNKIEEISTQGKTIFLTSHDMLEVNQLCNRVAILNKGEIVIIDTPENIRAKVGGEIVVEVSFDREVKLPGTEKIGNSHILYTIDPDSTIKEVVKFSKHNNVKILKINVGAPSLEEAFLKLTEEKP